MAFSRLVCRSVKLPIFSCPNCGAMDVKEFDHIFRSYHAALCVYAARLVKDAHLAEDLVEDVFMKVLQRSSFRKEVSDWRTFLYVAVRNTCYKHLQKSYELSPLDTGLLESPEEVNEEVLYTEIYNQIMYAIDQLPDKCGKVIRMAYLENKHTDEIASELGVTESTVYNQKARGLSLLRKMLSGLAFYSFFHVQ